MSSFTTEVSQLAIGQEVLLHIVVGEAAYSDNANPAVWGHAVVISKVSV